MKQVAINRVFIEFLSSFSESRGEDMSKVICPCVECIHNGNHYVCKADKVEFKYRNMATVNEGRVDMWICRQYELSEYAKKIETTIQESQKSDHKCHTCRHYTSGEYDGSCGSYICKGYSNWESEE